MYQDACLLYPTLNQKSRLVCHPNALCYYCFPFLEIAPGLISFCFFATLIQPFKFVLMAHSVRPFCPLCFLYLLSNGIGIPVIGMITLIKNELFSVSCGVFYILTLLFNRSIWKIAIIFGLYLL